MFPGAGQPRHRGYNEKVFSRGVRQTGEEGADFVLYAQYEGVEDKEPSEGGMA